jgi:hypothetical protein
MSAKVRKIKADEWREVKIPRPWRPAYIGEELIGTYGGRTVRSGMYGQYEVILVKTGKEQAFLVSGTDIIQRIDAAQLNIGDPVRIIWMGYKELQEDMRKKMFELYVRE